jgi:hypothetical protein
VQVDRALKPKLAQTIFTISFDEFERRSFLIKGVGIWIQPKTRANRICSAPVRWEEKNFKNQNSPTALRFPKGSKNP